MISQSDREFILAEYTRIAADLLANEAMGDSRMNFYATLWAAGAAGTAAVISQEKELWELRVSLALGLVGLVMLGLWTIYRLYRRDMHTDKLIDALARLRALLIRRKPLVRHALPWKDPLTRPAVKDGRTFKRNFGVLAAALLLNAGTFGLMGLLIAPAPLAPYTVIVVLMVLVLEVFCVERGFRRAHCRRRIHGKKFEALLSSRQSTNRVREALSASR